MVTIEIVINSIHGGVTLYPQYALSSVAGRCFWFLVLLASTAMHKLLSICNEYGEEFSVKFNAMKCKSLAVVVSRKRRWLSSELDFSQSEVGGCHVDMSNVICSLNSLIA